MSEIASPYPSGVLKPSLRRRLLALISDRDPLASKPQADRLRAYGRLMLALGGLVWLVSLATAVATDELTWFNHHSLTLAIILVIGGAVEHVASALLNARVTALHKIKGEIVADVSRSVASRIDSAVERVSAQTFADGVSAAEGFGSVSTFKPPHGRHANHSS